ncbi:MAG: hypothetical protein J7L69_06815 [Desulfobulbaceae bacterium]|nr:hypothetical protein [Desulfobulbaceae bacterium]
MKIAKKIKTILCDDVRQEVGGKMSIMGIYSKDIVVNKVPAILPFINLVVMFEDIKENFEKLFVTIVIPKSDPIKVSYPAPSGIEKGKDINLVLGLSPFKLNDTGKAKFEIRFSEDEKASIVHHFSIKVNEQV